MIKAYIDCNILIDWLLDREPFSLYAAKIIELIDEEKIIGYVSALTLANTYFIIAKELNRKIADEFLKDSLTIFRFTDMNEKTIGLAIEKKYKDFEDDLHYFAVLGSGLDFLITRNKKDFKNQGIRIVDSEEFLKIIVNGA